MYITTNSQNYIIVFSNRKNDKLIDYCDRRKPIICEDHTDCVPVINQLIENGVNIEDMTIISTYSNSIKKLRKVEPHERYEAEYEMIDVYNFESGSLHRNHFKYF